MYYPAAIKSTSNVLDDGQEVRYVSLNISKAFDQAKFKGFVVKLKHIVHQT